MHKIKKMRKKIYSLSIALLLGCSACNDWLTVQPATSILAEDLYATNVKWDISEYAGGII